MNAWSGAGKSQQQQQLKRILQDHASEGGV
jgi:hypothetical protein